MADVSEENFNRIKHEGHEPRFHQRTKVVRLPPPNGGFEAWGIVACAFTVMMHSAAMHYITGLFYVEWLKEWPDQTRAAVAGCGSLRCGRGGVLSRWAVFRRGSKDRKLPSTVLFRSMSVMYRLFTSCLALCCFPARLSCSGAHT